MIGLVIVLFPIYLVVSAVVDCVLIPALEK